MSLESFSNLGVFSFLLAVLATPAWGQLSPESILADSRNRLREPSSVAERVARGRELPRAPAFDSSTSGMSHFGSAKQASTWLSGPTTNSLAVQQVDLTAQLGKQIGASPWLVASSRRYRGDAVTLWGASLTDAFRCVVDGNEFRALDVQPINRLPVSMPWNLVAVDNGNVIVPDQDGWRVNPLGRTNGPTFLVYGDGPAGRRPGAFPMRLRRVVEVPEADWRRVCNPPAGSEFLSGFAGVFLVPTFTGELAVTCLFEDGGTELTYLVVLGPNLRPRAAGFVGRSAPSNDVPAEPVDRFTTAFYVPLDGALVKMTYDARTRTVARRWSRPVPVRARTGTTPTLMDAGGDRFVVLIDAKAAVSNGLNGFITYSQDTRDSELIAVRRDDDLQGRAAVTRTVLPSWLHTVENSPCARGDTIVVANYTGYLPNGLVVLPGGQAPIPNSRTWGASPDAVPDFATGIVALRYDPAVDRFSVIWSDPLTQISGIPTISDGANRVYGTGAERRDQRTYFYGYRLRRDAQGPAGEQVQRVAIGDAPFRVARRDLRGNFGFSYADYQFQAGEVFDQGNSLLVLEDESVIVNGGRTLVRVRDR